MTVNINIKDLSRNSRLIIKCKCENCNTIKELKYHKYLDNIERYGFYTCKKCSSIKKKMTFNKNYGVDNPMKVKEIKLKGKKTKLEKYGDKNYNNLEKHKKTNLEKYGFEHHLQNDDIKNKLKNTNLKKYGVGHFSKNKDYIKKLKIKKLKNNIKYYKDKYNFDIIDKKDSNYILLCKKCNNKFSINVNTLKGRFLSNINICTICNPINSTSSYKEKNFYKFIKDNYKNDIFQNNKTIIPPYELDIYLPDLNLAFEFNGVYWHNELYCNNDYHNKKTELCLEKGIQLIHIYEDDWIYKQDIIKSIIINKLNKNENKIYARKTIVKEINDNKLVRNFLDNNHIQGFIGSKVKLGLFFNNELVSLMTFGKLRKNMNLKSLSEDEYEMLRFCNKLNTNVIGGSSKLFKCFIRNYNPERIITYADRSYSNGNLYKQLGFKLDRITKPNFYYILNRRKNNRFNFRKNILVKQGFDKNKTEHQIMLERKIYRIYNSGNYKFIYKQK